MGVCFFGEQKQVTLPDYEVSQMDMIGKMLKRQNIWEMQKELGGEGKRKHSKTGKEA